MVGRRVGVLRRWCGGGHGHGGLEVDAGLVCVVPFPDVLLQWTWPEQVMVGSSLGGYFTTIIVMIYTYTYMNIFLSSLPSPLPPPTPIMVVICNIIMSANLYLMLCFSILLQFSRPNLNGKNSRYKIQILQGTY